jgi:hypothetical protein
VEHRIDEAERFRGSGERLAAVTLPIPALAHGISCIYLLGDDLEPGNEGSTWFGPSSTTERKVG